jgi:hypothetical protein
VVDGACEELSLLDRRRRKRMISCGYERGNPAEITGGARLNSGQV